MQRGLAAARECIWRPAWLSTCCEAAYTSPASAVRELRMKRTNRSEDRYCFVMHAQPQTGGWINFGANELPPPSRTAALTSLGIQAQILSTAVNHGNFASGVVDTLRRELGLTAATLFIRTRGLDAFKLVAANGFDYSGYASFLLPNPSYPSLACEGEFPTVLVAFPPFDENLFLNRSLLASRDIAALVVVPFAPPERSDTDYPDPLGALCLYAPESVNLDDLVSVCSTLASLLGALYIASLEQRCMHLRSEAVKAAAFENSLTTTAQAIIALMCRELQFEAGSLWLLDPRRQQLNLRAVYPALRRSAGALSANVVRHLDGSEGSINPLAAAFRTLHKTHFPPPVSGDGGSRYFAEFDADRIVEDFGETLENVVAVPLRTHKAVMLGHVPRFSVGVFSLSNKFTLLEGVKCYIPTTWEDLKLVSYMSEITTVLVYQGLQALDHEADYERRIHGLKVNLISVRDTLTQLEDRGQVLVPDPRMQYHMSNALEWVREMEQQVGRSDKIERLKVAPEAQSLAANVAKAVTAARISARANRIDDFVVDADGVLGPNVPPVRITTDSRAFQTVFRNLFENSIKYRDRNRSTCRVEIWIDQVGLNGSNHVELHYADNGVGIPSADIEHIFENGYRGRIARRVNVQGEGIGLHECQLLMQAVRGSISCVRSGSGSGAEFILIFPLVKISTPY